MMRWLGERDAFADFDQLSRDLQRLVGDLGGLSRRGVAETSGVYPSLNLYDDGESFIARAEVPGVDPKDLEITVTHDTLTIRGQRVEEQPEGASYHRRERAAGSFQRALTLPDPVNSDKVAAACKNGVLEVRMPRADHVRPRKVAIN